VVKLLAELLRECVLDAVLERRRRRGGVDSASSVAIAGCCGGDVCGLLSIDAMEWVVVYVSRRGCDDQLQMLCVVIGSKTGFVMI
jgi:hypothetical protein